MRWIYPTSLRARLLVALVAVQIAAGTAVTMSALHGIAESTEQLHRQRLEETLPLLTEAIAAPLSGHDLKTLERLIAGMVEQEGLAAVKVHDPDGNSLAESIAIPQHGSEEPGPEYELLRVPVWLDERRVGELQLTISKGFSRRVRTEAIFYTLTTAALGIILSAVAIFVLAIWVTRPLGRLRAAAQAVGRGDFTVRAPLGGADEVAQTALAFNRMLESLELSHARSGQDGQSYGYLAAESEQPILVLSHHEVLFANLAAATLWGYSDPAEMLRLDAITDLLSPESQEERDGAQAARLRGDLINERFEIQAVRANGDTMWLDCAAIRVLWEGQPAIQLIQHDITQQKAAQQALVETEAHFRDLIEGSIQGYFIVDRNLRILFANRAAAFIHGYDDPAELLALPSSEVLTHPGDRERLAGYQSQRLNGQAPPTQYEYRGIRRDGTVIHLLNSSAVVDWQGEPAVQVAIVDISERVRAEQALRDNEERFRSFAQAASDWLWETDVDDRLVYLSDGYETQRGEARSTYLGRTREEMALDLEDTDKWTAYRSTIRSRLPLRDFVYSYARSDQETAYLRINGQPLFDDGGRFRGYRGTAQDVTDEIRTQADLAIRELHYRTLVESAIIGIFVLGDKGKPIFLNARAAEMAGYDSVDEMLEMDSIIEMAAPHEQERLRDYNIARREGRPAPEVFEFQARRRDGSTLWLSIHARLVEWDGAPASLSTAIDITDRKLAELRARETELQFTSVVEASPIVVFRLDADGIFRLVGGKALDSVGLQASMLLGRSVFEVVSEYPEIAGDMRRALSGVAVQSTRRFGSSDFEIRYDPEIDPSGRVIGLHGLAVEITDRVQAEMAMQASEARFRDFARASADWLWETDTDDRFSYMSEAFTARTGQPTSVVLGKTRRELTLETDHPDKWQAYEAAVARREPIRDFEYHAKLGERTGTFRINAVPIFDDTGTFTGYRGTARDITEERRTLAALMESEDRFRDLVNSSLQGLLVLGVDRQILFANPAAAEIYGFSSAEDLMAIPSFVPLIAPEYREQLGSYLTGRLAGETPPTRYEHRGLRRDGLPVWLDTYVEVVQWAGAPAVQATILDITEQKAAAAELRASEAKFRRLIEESSFATFIFDSDWHLLFMNQAGARIYGFDSPEEALAQVKSGEDLVFEQDRAMLRRYREARRSGEIDPLLPRSYEFRAVRRDGSIMWLQNNVSIVDWEGQRASMSLSIDVTEHKQREEELRQAQKMEVVGQLTGGVAHDFNNLLTVVMGNLEMLQRRTEGDERLAVLARSALQAAERGSMLTQRLLAFSRRQSLQPVPIDINRLITGMTDLVQRTLGESIEVESVLAGGLWMALADQNQLENVLLNLAINARDAMLSGGKLTIETANARLDDEYSLIHGEVQPGQYVMLAVSDTGVGMAEDVIQRAFEPFFTTKEVGQGSGLGLSMVYGFVKQSGGHVKIYSEPGQGTTIKVYLPRSLAQSGAPLSQAADSGPVRGKSQSILVVEDDRAVRELAIAILTSLGYRAISAHDSATALEALAANPDIVLLFTDVVLAGGESGVELARQVTDLRPDIKVLYTSGYTENAIIHHGRLDEGVALLEKPYRIDNLARRLNAMLREDDPS